MNLLIEYLLMHSITAGDVIMNTLLMVVSVAVIWSLWKLHKANGRWNNFNLVYLLVNKDGFPDGAKCIEMGTWLLLSWGLIVYVTAKALPEWYLISYAGAFVARGGFGAYLRAKTAFQSNAGDTVATTTTTTETEVTQKGGGK